MRKILFLCLLVLSSCTGDAKVKYTQQKQNRDTLSVDNLRFVVYALPFKYKDIILAQAILETGWFTSDNYVINNNLFGMRRAFSRATTADSTINGYSHYPNWQSSVIDYFLLQSVTEDINPTHSREEYYRYLDRIYSEVGRGYSSQLKSIISRLREKYPEDSVLDQGFIQHKAKVNNRTGHKSKPGKKTKNKKHGIY
jgi:uncharacterized FlgJ-related protein